MVDNYTLVPLDQPTRLTQIFGEFTGASGRSSHWPSPPSEIANEAGATAKCNPGFCVKMPVTVATQLLGHGPDDVSDGTQA